VKVGADKVAEPRQTVEKPAADKAAVEATLQEPKPPQRVASLPSETTPVDPLAAGLLIKEIKIELKRTGCYSGRIDESWPKGSSNDAVQKFARTLNCRRLRRSHPLNSFSCSRANLMVFVPSSAVALR
jgi:hypothetical protein